jgi:iron complex outermembrane receptor protein
VDRTWRHIPGQFSEDLKTYDLDMQHRFPLAERHSILWGGGYRLMQDRVRNSPGLAFLPPERNLQLFSAFVQDEMTLVPDRLRFTLGTKVEHNDYSGFEIQPSGHLAWTPGRHHMIWAAVSRAVRSPSRIDRDFFIPGEPPFFLAGGPNFESETVLAYELGYRVRPASRVSLSLATFYNSYDHLRSVETNGPSLTVANGLRGQSWGAELSGEYRATDWWRLRGGYTYLHKDIWSKPGRTDINAGTSEGNDPEHQFVLHSILDLPHGFQLDLVGRYVDSLPAPYVPGYFTFDARLAWRYRNLELSIIGQNLSEPRHPEFGNPATRQEIPRSVFGKVTLEF